MAFRVEKSTAPDTREDLQHVQNKIAVTIGDELVPYECGKWGYVNTRGNTVIPFQYTTAEPFRHGQAIVSRPSDTEAFKGNVFGVIDRQGETVIPFHYLHISEVQCDREYFLVESLESQWGIMSWTGEWIVPPQFDSISPLILQGRFVRFIDRSKGFASFNLFAEGLYDIEKGQIIIPADRYFDIVIDKSCNKFRCDIWNEYAEITGTEYVDIPE